MSARRPLFSRQQLNWIIITLTIVIALLSLAPQPDPWPQLQQRDPAGVQVLTPVEASDQPPLVRVVLRLPPYLDAEAPLAASLAQLLGDTLDARPIDGLIQRHRLPDRLRLTLKAEDHAPLLALLTRLGQRPTATEFDSAERRLTAALRLASHRELPPAWPLQPVGNHSLTADYHNWLSRAQIVLVFNQPLNEAARQALAQALATLPAGTPWADPVPTLDPSGTRPSNDAQHRLQLVRELPGRRDPDYEPTLLAVRALQPLAATVGVRLDWQPRRDRSRLILSYTGPEPLASEALLDALRQQINATEDPGAALGERLLEQLRSNLAQPLGYLDLLETIASYQLPPDALTRFAATVERLESEPLRPAKLALLDSGAFRRYAARPLTEEAEETDRHAP